MDDSEPLWCDVAVGEDDQAPATIQWGRYEGIGMETEHLAYNEAHWDEVADLHRLSYEAESLVNDPNRLSDIVVDDARLMAPFLPDGSVEGLDVIHLQCHIGTDTLSWARMGARMTGVDLSGESLRIARDLADRAGLEIEYVQSSIHDAAAALAGRSYDVVYTSIGVLYWLDDLDEWARLIAGILRPGGIFFIREGHPMAMSIDPLTPKGELKLGWPYFNCGPQVDESDVDYSSPEKVGNARTFGWSHPLGEIIVSLINAGLRITDFQEHQTLPWSLFDWMDYSEELHAHVLPEPLRNLCPLAFSLVAQH